MNATQQRSVSELTKEDAQEYLRKILPPGKKVYAAVLRVARSGMSRHIGITVALIDEKGEPYIEDITFMVARAVGIRLDRDTWGLVVSGCGMDMCFHVVYELGRALYPNGFKLAPGQHGRNGDKSGHDNDGGYALAYQR